MNYGNQNNAYAAGQGSVAEAIGKQMAYAQDCGTAACSPTQLTLVEERFAQLIQGLVREGDRLQGICDRLMGSELQKEAAGTPPQPVPNGKLALFNMALDEAHRRLARISNLLDRVNQAI